jgi:hypothetical protein
MNLLSVQPLRSLCLCGEFCLKHFNHREHRESTEAER